FIPGSTPLFTQTRQIWTTHMPGKKVWFECSPIAQFLPGFIQKRNITLLTAFKVVDNSSLGKESEKESQTLLNRILRK
ncbi:hypothetical protein OS493_039846, partial [Desmophyllum pertusum]